MNILQLVQKMPVKRVPEIRTGYTVRVHQKIKEGEKTRIQIFEGLVIKVNSGFGADKTITVRKVVGGIGVEKIFPVHSTNIEKFEVIKKSKVRRAKLYYMRERSGKSARLKETFVSSKDFDQEEAPVVEESKVNEESTPEETVEVTETAEASTETPEVSTEPSTEETPEETKTEEAVTETEEKK